MISSIGNTGSASASYNITQVQERILKKTDANGDGSVSKEEFVSGRPKEVSEDEANEMWSKLDSSGKGSLTGSEFLAAIESQGPPPGPPPGESVGEGNTSVSSSTSNTSNITASDELVQALLAAIDKYMQSSKTQNQEISTNTMSSYA